MAGQIRGPYDPLRWFQMYALRKKGWSNRQIAMQFGVTPQAVMMTLNTPFPATRIEMLEFLVGLRDNIDPGQQGVVDGIIQLVTRLPEENDLEQKTFPGGSKIFFSPAA